MIQENNRQLVKQNKGEWSEFYALVKLLANGFVDLETATDPLRKKTIVVSVRKNETEFHINDGMIRSVDKLFVAAELSNLADEIKKGILAIKKNNSSLPIAEYLSHQLGISVKKQNSSMVADLYATMYFEDRETKYDLSIKSWLGGNPSFLNASKKSTKITYSIKGNLSDSFLTTLNQKKATDNLRKIYENEGYLEFHSYANEKFLDGLYYATADGPQVLADLVVCGYLSGRDGIDSHVKKELASIGEYFQYFKQSRNLFSAIRSKAIYEQRIKVLLFHFLMYQLQKGAPESNSLASDNYLAVLSDGNLLCIVGRERLEEKLFSLCKMDSPSASRHDYGYAYQKEGTWYIDLQPGIRLNAPS